MKMNCFLALVALSCCSVASSEIVYVTDMLQLGLHQEQDTSDVPLQNLASGTELEVLQRIPSYAQVRTADGREGWVKSAFLVADKPAQLIVTETIKELDLVRQELALARAEQAQAEQDAERIIAESSGQIEFARNAEADLAAVRRENEDYLQRLETFRGSLPVPWVVGALVFAVLGGFLFGVWSLDVYIRRRHGGFRLY